jgi:hypothetical protein
LPQNKPLSAPPPITLTASEVRYIEMRQKSNVEEAADRTLACQTTGLLCHLPRRRATIYKSKCRSCR